MSLWVDKHRPKKLSKLDYHTNQAQYLELLVKGGDFPHLLVYGNYILMLASDWLILNNTNL